MLSHRLVAAVLVALLFCLPAFAGTETEFEQNNAVPWDVLDGGGGLMCSPSYSIGGSLGQISPGVSVIETGILSAGYWAGIDSLPPCEPSEAAFIRGDVDGNGLLSIGDGLRCFRCQFVPGWQDSCECDDAVDADDNGIVSIGDCLRILKKQFVPGWQDSIPPPNTCGPDPTQEDPLGCDYHDFCMGVGKTVSQRKMIGGKFIPGEATIIGDKIHLPIHLSTNQDLSGFAYTISYDPSVLRFVSFETEGLVTEKFDFASALPEDGQVAAGNVVSFDFTNSLSKGDHHVADLVFEINRFDRNVDFRFTDAEFVDVNCKSLAATLSDAVIRGFMVPRVFALRQAFPNPFTGETTIRYQLPKESHVTLKIYNSAGQLLKTMVNEKQKPGYYRIEWDGKDEAGMKVASGVYF